MFTWTVNSAVETGGGLGWLPTFSGVIATGGEWNLTLNLTFDRDWHLYSSGGGEARIDLDAWDEEDWSRGFLDRLGDGAQASPR